MMLLWCGGETEDCFKLRRALVEGFSYCIRSKGDMRCLSGIAEARNLKYPREAIVPSVIPITSSDEDVRKTVQILTQLVASHVRHHPRLPDSGRPFEVSGRSRSRELIGQGLPMFRGFDPVEENERAKSARMIELSGKVETGIADLGISRLSHKGKGKNRDGASSSDVVGCDLLDVGFILQVPNTIVGSLRPLGAGCRPRHSPPQGWGVTPFYDVLDDTMSVEKPGKSL
ncbi:hypothetical protein RND71_032017 [Anisodus tanguticus]|uniref:Uncharacterized protein n=1 Tax=Anisodus tanguticus TaxID=243964 RepID=A0AAE1REL6_9SOLA|nr:hypothetical protein RND71_032017 [Anisodus tanguticus]